MDAGGVEDSRSASADTRRSEPKNEPASPRSIVSLLPADLPGRRAPSPDDRSDSSSDSATNDRVVSPSSRHHQPQQSYNMTYYGGLVPTHHQLLPHHKLQIQRQQHYLQSNHHHVRPADKLSSTYRPATGDESAVMEPDLYCSHDRDRYYGHYYAQNAAAPASVKLADDMDRI